ncbi:DUF354 domain-containing protein [Candidatus Bathyarchaeota archaeon]|nr:DUF354 domain-containing protein [Candidatus Bathyarchaeota archaeon]
MKIALDILTPKQCMFSIKLSEQLEKRGHKVLKTTRKYREVNQLLELKSVKAEVVGEHGGGNLANKLRTSAQRILELSEVIEDFGPNVTISFSSPEMARVSFGLGIPHISINDSPHAAAVARLTIPLSKKLMTPKMIPKKAWTKYGIQLGDIVQYNALDPWVWLKDFKPNRQILSTLMLDDSKPIVTFRTEESFASYLLHKDLPETTTVPLIKQVLEKNKNVQVVVVPRYEEQKQVLQKIFKDKITICNTAIDGPSLLYYTSIFIGGGGTMTSESVLLGVPTFSCYPNKPFEILKYLVKNEMVTLIKNPRQLFRKIAYTLDNLETVKKVQNERIQTIIKNFEDPVEKIVSEVEKLGFQIN